MEFLLEVKVETRGLKQCELMPEVAREEATTCFSPEAPRSRVRKGVLVELTSSCALQFLHKMCDSDFHPKSKMPARFWNRDYHLAVLPVLIKNSRVPSSSNSRHNCHG